MITELTKEQEAALDPYAKKWIDKVLKASPGQKINRRLVERVITSLYKGANLPKPEFLYAESPGHAQDLANDYAASVDPAWKRQHFSYSSYGSFSEDCGWVATYSFYEDILGLTFTPPLWRDYRRMIEEGGLFMSIQLEGAHIAVPFPDFCMVDEEGRLHSTGGKAIEWRDGWGVSALWGVLMPKALHAEITSRTITPRKVFALSNVEHRRVALQFLGIDALLADPSLAGKVIATSARGNTLLKFEGLLTRINPEATEEDAYALRYKCPSTGREYASFVPPNVAASGDPDACMAWKFRISPEDYAATKLES